jgi:predicted phosphodiesterase
LLKKIVKLLILLALTYGAARLFVVVTDSQLTGERAPYVQMRSTDSIVIRWLTENNHVGVLRYGEDSDHKSSVRIEDSSVKNHSIKLRGLKPGTKYYYQVGDIGNSHHFDADRHWFYTAPEETVATRIWVMGDSGKAGEIQSQVRQSAFDWMRDNPLDRGSEEADHRARVDVWLALGDLAYRSGTNGQFQVALFDPFEDLLNNTPLWPVYGNHDDRRWTYFRVFDLPTNAESGGVASDTENYYAFDYSNVHFIVLDSQASDRSANGDMARWLRQDLARNLKPWTVVAFHHPPYTKGSHDSDDEGDSDGRMQEMRENIVPILEQAGVDVVLSGHSHMYERSQLVDCAYGPSQQFSEDRIVSKGVEGQHKKYLKPLAATAHSGTIYMVAGSASKVDQGELDHPVHHTGFLEAGSVVIDVDGLTLTARFINNKGEVRDEFSITRQDGYKSDYKGCSK